MSSAMSNIRISELAMAYGGRVLFKDASQQFDGGSRYGLVGANGSGKSTLLRAMSGEEEATSGGVEMPSSTRVGSLKQDHFEYDNVEILDVVLMGLPELWAALQEKEELLRLAPSPFEIRRQPRICLIDLLCVGWCTTRRQVSTTPIYAH